MNDSIIVALISFTGGIVAAISPQLFGLISRRFSSDMIRDIRGRWESHRSKEPNRIHIIEIQKQNGRNVEGIRILKGGGKPIRKYVLKGYFSGDILSCSVIHNDSKESRILSLLLKIDTSDIMKGKLLLYGENSIIESTEEMTFIRSET